ncbi:MAG: cytochrome c [Ferruginibacter sp.]
MKYLFIVTSFIGLIYGCAKKNVPTASPAPVTPVTTAPDDAKITSATNTISLDKMVALGHETYTAKCGRCHGLKKVDDYTGTAWVPIMERMAIRAKLDSAEKANVISYVQANAKAG